MNGLELARVLLSHPVRLKIIDALAGDGGPMSAVGLSRQMDVKLGALAYHVRQLADAGALRLVSERRRRGAIETFWYPSPQALRVAQGLRDLERGRP